jgi:hypothetical protein
MKVSTDAEVAKFRQRFDHWVRFHRDCPVPDMCPRGALFNR